MTIELPAGAINLQHPDNIAAEPRAEAAAPAEKPESTSAAAPKKFAGKYESVEALEQGYRNSADEAQRILAREKAKDQEIANLKLQLQGRVNPAEVAAARRKPADELTEAMVPVDALGAYVQEEIAKFFEPATRNMQAREMVKKEYSEFATAEEKLNDYLTANPEINNRYQRMLVAKDENGTADPAAAMEWLLLRYQRTEGASAAAAADLSGQEQATARAVGALGSSSVGDRSTQPTAQEKLRAATEIAQRTGSIEPALKALVESGFISHPDLK